MVSKEWAGHGNGGGGALKEPSCNKISHKEPTDAQSFRVLFDVVILDSDRLTKFKVFSFSILIDCQELFDFGQNTSLLGKVIRSKLVRVSA